MKPLLQPRPVAHRGDIGAAPENTIPAFEAAEREGCCVETDIRRTADGEIVIFHDDVLDRVAMGNPEAPAGRRVNELSLEELKRIRLPWAGHLLRYFPDGGFQEEEWYYYPWEFDRPEIILRQAEALRGLPSGERIRRISARYRDSFVSAFAKDPKGEEIPTLREFLLWVRKRPEDFFAEIEFKERGLCPAVFRLLAETGTSNRCILMSGVPEQIREMQAYAARNGKPKGLRLGANLRFCGPGTRKEIRGFDLYEVGLNAGCFGKDDVERLAGRGIRVFSNLGDTPVWWGKLQISGAAAFKTNCVEKYLSWLTGKPRENRSRLSCRPRKEGAD